VLIACGVQLVRDRRPFAYGLLAVSARFVETYQYGLNDFYYYMVMMLLMAHGDGGPFEKGKRPLWVRHALLAQLAWVYFATAVLKLNADWIGGGQLFARTAYLVRGFDWPYPSLVRHAMESLHFCAILAYIAVIGELLLALVLSARRPYWLGVVLAVGIHGFAMVITNVWFFSVSNIVAVTLLLPRRTPRARVRSVVSQAP
jgi:Vitamin K-dependent gamma-carboxylase